MFLPRKALNSNHELNYLINFICLVFLPLSEYKAEEQVSLRYIPIIFPELNINLIWYLSIETPLR